MTPPPARRLVVKLGSALVAAGDGPRVSWMAGLADDVAVSGRARDRRGRDRRVRRERQRRRRADVSGLVDRLDGQRVGPVVELRRAADDLQVVMGKFLGLVVDIFHADVATVAIASRSATAATAKSSGARCSATTRSGPSAPSGKLVRSAGCRSTSAAKAVRTAASSSSPRSRRAVSIV